MDLDAVQLLEWFISSSILAVNNKYEKGLLPMKAHTYVDILDDT